jgi:pyruvate formate lyase activating enzyme
VRENRDGDYYTLVHANPCAVHIDPIEKKPLFQFLPGTAALSIATAGCNFTCKNCQNYDISQARPDDTINVELFPEDVVALALKYDTPTIAYTYTEPTIFFEYMLETAKIARKKGVLNIYHSNGYINQEALNALAAYLDGANVDLKGFSNAFYQEITGGTLDPVLQTLKTLKKRGVWLEITNLVIPTKNDSDEMIRELCSWIESELGKETPVHFSRFYPQYKLQNLPPTPVETLKRASEIAHQTGLDYVYIGNVPGVEEENTYCPGCGKVAIGRTGYHVSTFRIRNGECEFCGEEIAGRWK